MCLTLVEDSYRLKKNLRRRKGPIIGYKVLIKTASSTFQSGLQNYTWILDQYQYDKKRNSHQLEKDELFSKRIDFGFHFFTNTGELKETPCGLSLCKYQDGPMTNCKGKFRNYICQGCFREEKLVIGKFEINPEDIVAVGVYGFSDCNNFRDSFVSRGAKLVKIIEPK